MCHGRRKLPADALHIREEAASLRKLAAEHEAAGNVAVELDAKADQAARGSTQP